MKSKAAILIELKKPLIIEDIEIPNLEFGQVLVDVHYSGICGAQLGEIAGANGEDKHLPHLLGHEGGGIVLEVGQGVKTIKQDDPVVMHWRRGDGIESDFPKYKLGSKIIGGGRVTTFNRYAVVSENRLTTIKEKVPLCIAALMGCAVTTALGLINNEAKLKIGQSIAIVGTGGVGLNIIQGANMVSANPIIAIDQYEKKLVMAKEMGATHMVNSNQAGFKEEIKKIVENKGLDVFVDCTGNSKLIDQCYSMVAPGGKMILVGQPHYNTSLVLNSMRQHYCGKILMDSQGGLTNPAVDIPRYSDLYLADKLKFDSMVSHNYSLDNINIALDALRDGQVKKCVIDMRQNG